MSKMVTFIFLFSGLSVSDRVRIQPCPQFDPSALFPIGFKIQIYTELFSLSVEIYFIVVSCSNLLIVSSRSSAYFHTADTDCVLQHFTPHFDLIGVLVLIDFQDSDLSLNHKKNDGYSLLIASKTNTDICGTWIKKQFTFFIHFEEQITGLDEEFFLVCLGDCNIFLKIRDKFTSLEISIVSQIVAEFFQVCLIWTPCFDAGGVLHCDVGKSDILVNEGQLCNLSFFVDVEHHFCFYFCQKVGISFKAHI